MIFRLVRYRTGLHASSVSGLDDTAKLFLGYVLHTYEGGLKETWAYQNNFFSGYKTVANVYNCFGNMFS